MGRSFDRALSAFNGPRFKFAAELLIALQKIDNERHREMYGDGGTEAVDVVYSLLRGRDGRELNKLALYAMDGATCDAMAIVMYAGRDGDATMRRGDRYDPDRIESEFAEWWDHLGMDTETHAREIMAEKWPLDRYLTDGVRMFRIDER